MDGNKNDEPVGMGITIPSLSHALKKCHRGRLLPFGWWHLLRAIKWHKTDGVDLLLIGFLPEYRAKGANALWKWKAMSMCRASGDRSAPSTTNAGAAIKKSSVIKSCPTTLLTITISRN